MDEIKIKEQFHYFNIQSEIDSVYGNWAVSKEGDVVNCLYPYAIFAIHLHDANWLDVLKQKSWFLSECELNLSEALYKAKTLVSQR